MKVLSRFILWLGTPCVLVRARRSLTGRLRWCEVQSAAAPAEDMPPDEGDGGMSALLDGIPEGSVVDVIWRDHLLQVETFPALMAADREDALKTRLRRDLILPLESLEHHTAWLDSPGRSQAVFAAVLASRARELARLLSERGLQPGRTGFAGQLAIAALPAAFEQGTWTLIGPAAGMRSLLIGRDPSGGVLARAFPDAPHAVSRDAVREQLDLIAPGQIFDEAPAPLAVPPQAAAVRLREDERAVPNFMASLLPAFSRRREWRRPSRRDQEYPMHFSGTTWSAAAVVLGLALYTGTLWAEMRGEERLAREVAEMQRKAEALTTEAAQIRSRLSGLGLLEEQMNGLGAEAFDNPAWMTFLGDLRDRCASGLLFDAVSIRGPGVILSGRETRMELLLRFYECLARVAGDDSVKLRRLDAEKTGRTSFVLALDRGSPVPPALPAPPGE